MNDAGLAVSLTFGGRRVLGDGFGIPIVVRYLLEVCETVEQARETIARLPFSLAHNLTIVDRDGRGAHGLRLARPCADLPVVPGRHESSGAGRVPRGGGGDPHDRARAMHRRHARGGVVRRRVVRRRASCGPRCSAPRTRTAGAPCTRRSSARARASSTTAGPSHTWRLGFDGFREGEHTEVLADAARTTRRPRPSSPADRRADRRRSRCATRGRRVHDLTAQVRSFAADAGARRSPARVRAARDRRRGAHGDGQRVRVRPRRAAGSRVPSRRSLCASSRVVGPRRRSRRARASSRPSLVVPVVGGAVQLGTWQSVVLVDPNRDNDERTVRLSFVAG